MRRKYKPELDGTSEDQYSFDFKDWEDAFDTFYRKKRKNKAYCLVISTYWVTSGYWVEKDAKTDEYSKVYRSFAAVQNLEKRIRERGEEVVRSDGLKRKDCINLGGLVV